MEILFAFIGGNILGIAFMALFQAGAKEDARMRMLRKGSGTNE